MNKSLLLAYNIRRVRCVFDMSYKRLGGNSLLNENTDGREQHENASSQRPMEESSTWALPVDGMYKRAANERFQSTAGRRKQNESASSPRPSWCRYVLFKEGAPHLKCNEEGRAGVYSEEKVPRVRGTNAIRALYSLMRCFERDLKQPSVKRSNGH